MAVINYSNFRNFNFSNKIKSIYEENKKNAPKPSYTTKEDYEKVIENIEIGCNDEEAKKALKNFNNIKSKIT